MNVSNKNFDFLLFDLTFAPLNKLFDFDSCITQHINLIEQN